MGEAVPEDYNWGSLRPLSGNELENHYSQIITALGQGIGEFYDFKTL
jgi:hypothetical protein